MVSKDEVKGWMREVLQEGAKIGYADHVVGCPDCYKEVFKKANETMDYHCENCGLPIPEAIAKDENASCPNCGCEDCDEISMEDRMLRVARR